MKKRMFNSLLAAALCGIFVTGCSGETKSAAGTMDLLEHEEETSKEGIVSLTVWTEENNVELMNEMIESFRKEYAGQAEFDIQIIEASDSGTRDRMLGDIHSAADVFTLADDQLISLAAGGTLSEVPNADEIRKVNSEGSVQAASIGDTLYAYPMSADNGFFLYYDKRYFTEEDVQSLDRILEIAAENEKKFSMEWDSGWYLYAFFGNTGLEFGLNEDGVTNYCNWNTTEGDITGVDIVNAMLDIAENPGFLSITDSEFISNIQNGNVIAGVSGVWNAMEVRAVWGADYGAVKLPTYTCAGRQIQMSSFAGYKLVGVNAYSEHLEWAHKFARWITNEQNQVRRFEVRNQGPSNIAAASSDAVNQVPAIRAVIEQSQYGVLQRVGNNYWTPFAEFGETLVAGNPAGMKPQELIDALVAGITASTVN